MKTSVLEITGMSCGACVRAVQNALLDVPGVESADVSLENNQATVAYDPETATLAQMRAAVTEEGYDVNSANGESF